MNARLVPYYLTRLALSLGLSLLVFGVHWAAMFFSVLLFGLFVVYLKSGWFVVDASTPVFPLRRDDRAMHAQRRALTVAIVAAGAAYLAATSGLLPWLPVASAATVALAGAVAVYFGLQWYLLSRA